MRWRAWAQATAALTAVVTMLVGVPAPPAAEAATLSGFDRGYLVSDANFYDATAMTAAQVQSLLDTKGKSCQRATGDGYAPCLKDYTETTPTIAADAYCANYAGQKDQTVAQMVTELAKNCGISPRTLLVTMQKESGLITAPAPKTSTYDSAMGFSSCPNGVNVCASSASKFFKRLYQAARLFKIYRATASTRAFKVGSNTIAYHPKDSCGTAKVTIKNQATAGLYNYTPYTPNAAALASAKATGDDCSTYGNRNFWVIWSDWFGSPTGDTAAASPTSASPSATQPKKIATGTNVTAGGQWYYIDGDTKIAWSRARAKNYGFTKATRVTKSQLALHRTRSARLLGVKCGSASYLVVSGKLRKVEAKHVSRYPFGFAKLTTATCKKLTYVKGRAGKFLKTSGGTYYLIQKGTKRKIASAKVYRTLRGAKHTAAVTVSGYFLRRFPNGKQVR